MFFLNHVKQKTINAFGFNESKHSATSKICCLNSVKHCKSNTKYFLNYVKQC